jgi:hypothetical protein
MPSGSSETHVTDPERYGRAGFFGAIVNILFLEFLTAVFMLSWYMIPVTVFPVLVVDALIAFLLTRGRATAAQIGRGMLIGCVSAPLTIVIGTAAFVILKTTGAV